jgi:hypothetical protein
MQRNVHFLLLLQKILKPDRFTPPPPLPQHTKVFKVARYVIDERYVIYDDAIIAMRISTNDKDINNNYNMIKASVRRRALDEKWSYEEVARKG